MLITAELRWFWPEICPSEIENWFMHGERTPGGGNDSQPRVDKYYHQKGNRELGIKVRNQREGVPADLEVKGLIETIGNEFRCGPVELWCKWKGPPMTAPSAVSVSKVRWLRSFDADTAVPVEIPLGPDEKPLTGHEQPRIGCNVELTRLSVGGRPENWWSLCFEAFGGTRSAPDALNRVMRGMEVNRPLPQIDRAPLSYPAWLDSL
jgi:hypothetical protein